METVMMFKVGEKIVYAHSGVATVTEVAEEDGRIIMTVRPDVGNYTVKVPAESDKVFMRPVMSREEAEELIDAFPSVNAAEIRGKSVRELTEWYESLLKSHDMKALVELTKAVYRKKTHVESQNKKLGAVDAKFMKRAEDLLFGELAVALGITRDEVPDYIDRRLAEKGGEEKE